jgi:putative membrane protein
MLAPSLQKNDAKAKRLISIVSVIVFAAVTVLGKYNLAGQDILPFSPRIFATLNAIINGTVALLLVAGLVTAKRRNFVTHRNIMLLAMLLSILFLISYIGHHLFAGETAYGETDGIKGLSDAERAAVGSTRGYYLVLLLTHIPLAGLALPFILWAAYRALTGEYALHKKMVRWVWPIWFYVAISGVVIYFMISPFYK